MPAVDFSNPYWIRIGTHFHSNQPRGLRKGKADWNNVTRTWLKKTWCQGWHNTKACPFSTMPVILSIPKNSHKHPQRLRDRKRVLQASRIKYEQCSSSLQAFIQPAPCRKWKEIPVRRIENHGSWRSHLVPPTLACKVSLLDSRKVPVVGSGGGALLNTFRIQTWVSGRGWNHTSEKNKSSLSRTSQTLCVAPLIFLIRYLF